MSERINRFGVILLVSAVVALYALTWYCYVFVRSCSIGYEGPIIWSAVELARGGNIYPLTALSNEPWISILYPPLYMLISAMGALVAPLSYSFSRLVSCVASAAAAIFLYRTLRLQDCSKIVASAFTALYFSFGFVHYESGQCRPDMLCVGFGAAGLFFLVKYYRQEKSSEPPALPLVLLAVLLALSLFAKQQGIVFFLAALLALVDAKRLRAAGILAALWAAFGLVPYLVTQVLSGGFFANLTLLSAVKSRSEILITNLASVALDCFKLVFCLVMAPIGILKNKSSSADEKLPLLLFFVSAAILSYSMGIPASNVNHLIPAVYGLCWFVALTMRKLPESLCLILIPLVGISIVPAFNEQLAMMKMESRARQDIAKLRNLNLSGKPVLTDDVYLNLVTESKPVFVDCATFINVWKDSGKGFEALNGKIAAKAYPAIIINELDYRQGGSKAFWPPEVIACIKQNYAEKDILFCGPWILVLLLPKP